MSEVEAATYNTSSRTRYIIVGVIVVLAFFAAYGYSSAQANSQQAPLYATDGVTPAGYGGAYAEGEAGSG